MGKRGISKNNFIHAWQKEPIDKWIKRLNEFIDETRDEFSSYNYVDDDKADEKVFTIPFIAPSFLIINMCDVYNSHWRRDMLKQGVVDGKLKLKSLTYFLAWQETYLDNQITAFRKHKNVNGIGLLINQYYNKQMTDEDFSLEENENVKDNIKITLETATGKLGLTNGDNNK